MMGRQRDNQIKREDKRTSDVTSREVEVESSNLPASKVFDLKVVRSDMDEVPVSTHSFCTSCSTV